MRIASGFIRYLKHEGGVTLELLASPILDSKIRIEAAIERQRPFSMRFVISYIHTSLQTRPPIVYLPKYPSKSVC